MFTTHQFIDLLYRELHRLLDFRAEFGWMPADRQRFDKLETALFNALEREYCS